MLNRIVPLGLLLFVVSLCGWAQPDIEFETTSKDFGVTTPGKKLHHDFLFTNQGNRPLIIDSVQSSCGCTAAILSATTIPAGATDIISVTMTTASTTTMKKYVTVRSNDPDNPSVNLEVLATVQQLWSFYPQSNFNLGDVQQNGTASKTIFLRHSKGEKRNILSTRVNNPKFKVEIGEETAEGIPVTVHFQAGQEEGTVTDVVEIRTDDLEQADIRETVIARVVGPLRFTPKNVFFGTVKKGETVTRQVEVRVADPKQQDQFKITELNSKAKDVQGKILKQRPDGSYVIELTFSAPETQGFKRGLLEIKSNVNGAGLSTLTYSAIVH
jgi:hypothetical protein